MTDPNIVSVAASDWQTFQYIVIGLGGAVSILIVAILLLFIMTPAWTFFRAKLKGESILILLTENLGLRFHPVKYRNGAAEVKGVGRFFYNPRAMLFGPNGIRMAVGFDSLSALIPREFMQRAYDLVKAGIENIQSAEGKVEEVRIKAMLRNLQRRGVAITATALRERGFDDETIRVAEGICREDEAKRLQMLNSMDVKQTVKDAVKRILEGQNPIDPWLLKEQGYSDKEIYLARNLDRINANEYDVMNYLPDLQLVKNFLEVDATPTKVDVIVERERKDVLSSVTRGILSQLTPMHITLFMGMAMMIIIAWIVINSGNHEQMINAFKEAMNSTASAATQTTQDAIKI